MLELSDSEHKNLWKLARVTKVIPGHDDHVRKVMIKCMGGESELLRPVTRLLPLEFA